MSLKTKCIISFFAGIIAMIVFAMTAVPILNRKKPEMMMDVYHDIRNM